MFNVGVNRGLAARRVGVLLPIEFRLQNDSLTFKSYLASIYGESKVGLPPIFTQASRHIAVTPERS